MDNIIVIDDLTFQYNERIVFDRLNLKIKKGSFTTILGSNGSGKSTLIKIILGLEKGSTFIFVGGLPTLKENEREIRKRVGVVFENPDKYFVNETVMDEIAFSLENLRMDPKKIQIKIEKLAKLLEITDILEREPHSLSIQEKQLVSLASALIIKPEILILDDGLNGLDSVMKEKVLNIITDLNKNDNLTIVNVTNDIEDCLYGDNIVLLNKGKVLVSGLTEEILKEEQKFEEANLELPFIVALSNKLKFYNLINKTYFNPEKLVDDLWE